MATDTSENGFETLIVADMTTPLPSYHNQTQQVLQEASTRTLSHWLLGSPNDYLRDYALDLHQLTQFIQSTQPTLVEALDLAHDSPTRRKFLTRLREQITQHGTIHILRHGIKHEKYDIMLYYPSASVLNPQAMERYLANRFSITRQLRYSSDTTRRALDLALFINGLPIFSFELKNNLTCQTTTDAIRQYQQDRDPKELLFQFGRCIAHFALDEQTAYFCTELKAAKGKNKATTLASGSWFLPFNQGWNDGAGNPPNPHGIKTKYLWKRILTPSSLNNILENYAQIVTPKDPKTGKKKRPQQIFPRYHQLDVVRQLLADIRVQGVGKRYLIQHSAGSGKSNSIAWLAHQLVTVEHQGQKVFDSVIILTDRKVLDQQINATIRHFMQVQATVGHATRSQALREFIEAGKPIIISTIQKFPKILNEIGSLHRGRNFAIVIDEAHSSQGGKTAAAVNESLGDPEDTINDALEQRMQARQMLSNASYFAFTATPKAKTLELFGILYEVDGEIKHKPFHHYSMKQAIQEGFILDVLQHYTPIDCYYDLIKTIEADPQFDATQARKKLRHYVQHEQRTIDLKTRIMVDHFHEQVIALRKLAGKARAMVVCGSIAQALQYYFSFKAYLQTIKSPYQAIVAFSGEPLYKGEKCTEASVNGFASSEIPEKIQQDPYRFLICADKFQTGYDEPLLHTMYVDKPLAGIQAVQTLSRLNRAHPDKTDVFVLDFMNNSEAITEAFSTYYRTTLLSKQTDPNRLHQLKHELDQAQIYTEEQINTLVSLYLSNASRERLDAILDQCVANYLEFLAAEEQIRFKSNAKAFVRTYEFLASILTYTRADWEKLSIFLNLLVRKLPSIMVEDDSKDLLKLVDLESYRAEKQASLSIILQDEDAEVDPSPVGGDGQSIEPALEKLSAIIQGFNAQYGSLFTDPERLQQRIREDIAPRVAADPSYQNAKLNTPATARVEHDNALQRVIISLLMEDTELFKQFMDNPEFRRALLDFVFSLNNLP